MKREELNRMDSLISVINKLQNIFHAIGEEAFQLPQIVAVGEQSSGKSSVIENILGKSFLPKGIGTVTRQPLILQLVNVPKEEKLIANEFGIFQHKKNVVFKNFDEIRSEIESETNSKAGKNKEISEEPIRLTIYSKNVVNLTIIDLPGLTKVPVGNQPPDIEGKIRNLVTKYISNPNSIILAVVTANTDMTTSESLKLAREFDREGCRTIAVVTKLDLMDAGTDATDILSGKIVPVKLGIIGVVNRSQRDTLNNKLIIDAITDEANFLRKHYPTIAKKHGTPYLSQTLNKILTSHIQKCLPDIKVRINNVRAQTLSKLQFFGDDVVDNSKALLHVITSFCTAYCSALDGTSRQIETTKLSGGARICYIFHETFGKTLDYIQPLIGLSKYDILTAMRNSSGTRPALFVPETCFEVLVKRQIIRLLEPSLRCVELIHEEMQQILQSSWNDVRQEMLRFPKLFLKIITIASEIIRRRLTETNAMVENLINIELAYINTMHPEFRKSADINLWFCSDKHKGKIDQSDEAHGKHKEYGSSRTSVPGGSSLERRDAFPAANILSLGWFTSLLPVHYISRIPGSFLPYSTISQPRVPKASVASLESLSAVHNLTDRDKHECEAIEKLVSNYFNIIKKSIQDKVPKVIMHCLVNFVKENIQRELVELLYRPERDESLLEEPEQLKMHREEQKYILKTLDDVDQMLNEVRDTLV